jgi:transposase-like protein
MSEQVEAVRLYESSGKSMRAIEQELGITPYLLAKCVQGYRQREAKAFPGKGDPKAPECRPIENCWWRSAACMPTCDCAACGWAETGLLVSCA